MSEKRRNIKQRPDEHYPQPGIPESEAWGSMREMLDNNMPVKGHSAYKIGVLITGAILGALVLLVTLLSQEPEGNLPADSDHTNHTPTTSRQALPYESLSPGPPPDTRHGVSSPSQSKPEIPGETILQPGTRITRLGDLPALNRSIKIAPPGNLLQAQIPVPPVEMPQPETDSSQKRTDTGFSWGIQLGGNFALKDLSAYPGDPEEKKDRYLLLIPGIWMNKKLGERGIIHLGLRPYFDYFTDRRLLNRSVIGDSLSSLPNFDPTIEELYLRKLHSSSATVRYRQQLFGNLWLGAGMTYHHHHRALVSQRVNSGLPQPETPLWFSRRDEEWAYLRPLNFSADLEVMYQAGRFGLGGSLFIPLMAPEKYNPGKIRPLNGQLFFRWRLSPD